jgi:uncharacterized membrane protein
MNGVIGADDTRGKWISRGLAAVMFIVAGVLHFVFPSMYRKIIPTYLPAPGALVAISGVAEIAGGMGLLVRPLRRAAGWGLIALLVAVFPANIYMAVSPERVGVKLPGWMLWGRLPLQFVVIGWVWSVMRTGERERESHE